MFYRLALRLLVLTGAFCAVAVAQAAGTAQQALLDADAERVAAFQTGDAGRIAALLGSELTYVHSSGIMDGKEQLLAKIKSGELTYQSIKVRDVVARPYGTAGVVTASADVHVLMAHKPLVLAMRYTATYALHEGHWQLVAYESTLLPG